VSYTLVSVPFPKEPTLILGRLMFCNPRTHSAETWLLFFYNSLVPIPTDYTGIILKTLCLFASECYVVSRVNEGLSAQI
jgi:hypothetical protein